MNEIPDDVKKAVEAAAARCVTKNADGLYSSLTEIMTDLVMAERRRCLDLADTGRPEAAAGNSLGYVITGVVGEGEHKGDKVWLHWSEEGGGWWQWGPEGWASHFPDTRGERFNDALRCALGQTWTGRTCGPYYYAADKATVVSEVYGGRRTRLNQPSPLSEDGNPSSQPPRLKQSTSPE